MKFLNQIRSRSKVKSSEKTHGHSRQISHPYFSNPNTNFRPNPTARFPVELLQELFAYVCPHVRDSSYVSNENSMLDAGCMLCDMRDLAHCVSVNRQWNKAGQTVLYSSVRIDAVHYCEREYDLAQKRKRKSFTGRSGDIRDPAHERLALFARTVRENNTLAVTVQYLKLPVMMRESSKADLARAVSVLPNLRYVDLPESFYASNPAARTLRLELEARCPDIRRMKYTHGSEHSFPTLGRGGQWPNLEILELDNLAIDPSTLDAVISSLPHLTTLLLTNVPTLDNTAMSLLPPVPTLAIKDSPEISIEGIANYFAHPGVDSALTSLSLSNTAIPPSTLNQILASAPHLLHLAVAESVARPLPAIPPPPLVSKSLQTLHYEISSAPSTTDRSPPSSSPSASYYTYLAHSLSTHGLPALSSLYALFPHLPSLLLSPHKSIQPFEPVHTILNLYTKSTPELEWNLTVIPPLDGPESTTTTSRRGSVTRGASEGPRTRPVSLYHPPALSPQWRGGGGGGGKERESVMVGNGFGGFLMVPAGGGRGVGEREREERDGWMG